MIYHEFFISIMLFDNKHHIHYNLGFISRISTSPIFPLF